MVIGPRLCYYESSDRSWTLLLLYEVLDSVTMLIGPGLCYYGDRSWTLLLC